MKKKVSEVVKVPTEVLSSNKLQVRMTSVTMSSSVSKAMTAFSAELIRACASKYGFDGEEALRELNVSIGPPTSKKASKAKVPKAAAHPTPSIPLPFTGTIRDDCCNGVKQNHGLYTQCFSAVSNIDGDTGLCKGCIKQASKNASGEPDCGLIAKRVMQGGEYRDAKGRAPVHYTKVMKKQKLTKEQVLAEASKFGIEIDESHFAVPETKRGRPKKATTSDTESDTSSAGGEKKKARGRPKKAPKVVEVNETEDLFASLMQQAQSASPRPPVASSTSEAVEVEEDVSDVSSGSDSETEAKPLKKTKKQAQHKEESEEALAEKATKFLEKEDEKEKKATAKAAAKEAEKQEKAAAKLAQKEAEKATKEAAKAAAKALAEQDKATKKPETKQKKTKAAAATVVPAVQEPVADLESEAESEDDKPVVTVKKFEHEGVSYLKSSDGVLYDAKSQEVVGKWNETTKSIDVYDGESEEEEDSDDEDE